MIITQTPLRVSFAGGGTDFEDFYSKYGGAVFSTAINKYVFAIISKRFDDMVSVNYSKRESVSNIENLNHELIREALKLTGIDRGVEITTLSDVPGEGTGLGSSSSVTISVLHVLHSYLGNLKTAQDLADEACHIEIDILKKPIGKQDQYIAAYGNMQFITFNDSGVKIEKIKLCNEKREELNKNLLLFYTGISRKSSDILSEQKAKIGHQTEVLAEMKKLAYRSREAVIECEFDDLGRILHEAWILKKKFADTISNDIIDEIYEAALRAGAIGGKITGAGGGGFLLLYCNREKQDNVRSTLRGLRELPFRFEKDGSKVIFNYNKE